MENAISILILASAFLLFTLGVVCLTYAGKLSKSR
jgi:hypothetical protein